MSAKAISEAVQRNPSAADGAPPPAGSASAPSTSVGPWFVDVSADGAPEGAGVEVDVAAWGVAVGGAVGDGVGVPAAAVGVGVPGCGVGDGVATVDVAVGVPCSQSTSIPVNPPDS